MLKYMRLTLRHFLKSIQINKNMIETKFKALMYGGQYVDSNILENGIYNTTIPRLYSIDTTIEMLVEQGRMIKDISGNNFIMDSYFTNLNKCQLVEVVLSLSNIPNKTDIYLDDSKNRYFLDIRAGCAAIRDREHKDYDESYPGLHHYTPDVVEYIHGYTAYGRWTLSEDELDRLRDKCNELNKKC